MSEPDNSLLAEFNARRSEDAFAALVRQHVNLVFATALRQVGDAGAAEEITQNVFVALAQAAGKLGSHPTIAGWLHQTALNKSREWLRSELRRRKREQVAVNLNLARAEGDSVWSPLVPLLDEALLKLREPDRQAVILHFMEGQTFQEVGSTLGIGEDTARKRVHRCLDQLTQFFRRRGFAVPAIAAGAPLFTLSSHAAPAGLAASATTAGLAAAHSAASTSTLTLIKGALKIMAWTKAKTAVVVGLVVILGSGITVSLVSHAGEHPHGQLLNGTHVELEGVTSGKQHSPPIVQAPFLLQYLPNKRARTLNWNAGETRKASTTAKDIFVFWLKFSRSDTKPMDYQTVGYAVADEKGFEIPMVFDGPNLSYRTAGFGTNQIGLARGTGNVPWRSRTFFLRLYQLNRDGKRVRVGEFPIANAGLTNYPKWIPEILPIAQETNGVVFTLAKAQVGITPSETVLPPYDLQAGLWSEFRFQVSEHGNAASGWTINEMTISAATGEHLRISKEDNGALNGTFSRIDGDEIVCLHRWEFFDQETAWKIYVHFEHPSKLEKWVEYTVKPEFINTKD